MTSSSDPSPLYPQAQPGRLRADIAFEPLRQPDLAELTYEAIRRRILTREYATGDQIPVDLVAAQLGVSRTPVIDALKRLAGERLVDIRARRGSFVRAMSADDLREIFEVREAIELYGARLALREGRGPALAASLAEALEAMKAQVADEDTYSDYDAFIVADRAFHLVLVDACANKRLREVYTNLHVHLQIMRVHYQRVLQRPCEVVADHLAIIDGIRTGSIAAAEAAITAHVTLIRSRITAVLSGPDDRL